MISVSEALKSVLTATGDYGTEYIPLMESVDRFLAEDIVTDRDSPPFDRVTMDGIAVHLGNATSIVAGSYPIEGIQAAGAPRLRLKSRDNCLEVMTGAILPEGTDAVIPYEEITIKHGIAHIQIDAIAKRNIHRQGADAEKGKKIIKSGQKINAGDIGVLATVGKSRVKVARFPKVAIISTGDELVDIDQIPAQHQIRKSNVYSLWAGLKKDGIHPEMFHILDDKADLQAQLSRLLNDFDVLLLSGGVSKGKYDHIPGILDALGVEKHFHRVAQRPGKPFWFGSHPDLHTKVFAFPGNPLATFVGYHFYFRQWLHHSLGGKLTFAVRALEAAIPANPNIAQFISAQINPATGGAIPLPNNGSGDLFSLAQTDGFLLLPQREEAYQKGEKFEFIAVR